MCNLWGGRILTNCFHRVVVNEMTCLRWRYTWVIEVRVGARMNVGTCVVVDLLQDFVTRVAGT